VLKLDVIRLGQKTAPKGLSKTKKIAKLARQGVGQGWRGPRTKTSVSEGREHPGGPIRKEPRGKKNYQRVTAERKGGGGGLDVNLDQNKILNWTLPWKSKCRRVAQDRRPSASKNGLSKKRGKTGRQDRKNKQTGLSAQ